MSLPVELNTIIPSQKSHRRSNVKRNVDRYGNVTLHNRPSQVSNIRKMQLSDGSTALTNRESGSSIYEGGQPYYGAGNRTNNAQRRNTPTQPSTITPKKPEYAGLKDIMGAIQPGIPVYQQLQDLGFKCNNGVWMYKNDNFKVYCKIDENGYTFQSMPLAQHSNREGFDAFYQRITVK